MNNINFQQNYENNNKEININNNNNKIHITNEIDIEFDNMYDIDYLKEFSLSDSKDSNSLKEIIEFDSLNNKIPLDFTKEKKMSLIISSMSELLFKKDERKHQQILKFLVDKNIIDKEVLNEKYNTFRNGLSLLLDSYTKENNLEDFYKDMSSNVYRNNYNQIKLLGQGSFGTVYKVFHKLERKYYAIKKIFLTKEIFDDNLNIINETYLYSQLEHPNIVKYHHSWVSSDFQSVIEFNQITDENGMDKLNNVYPVLFIQMELCDFTLDEYLMTQVIDDTLKKRMLYFKDILQGVMYLHKNQIIHRDIKPNNIFFKDNGKDEYIVKIGDLGLCKTENQKLIQNTNDYTIDFYKNYTNNILCDDMSVVLMSNHLEKSFHKPNEITHSSNFFNSSNSSNFSNSYNSFNSSNSSNFSNSSNSFNSFNSSNINQDISTYNFDIYSLGIVLFRFLLVCNTEFEKIKTIISLKSNPENINNFDNLISNCYNNLIIKMLSKTPPSLEEILEIIN